MSKTYTRLTEDERYQIYEGVTEKLSHREIARLINKHHSTVSKEVKRNIGLRGYRPKQAQEKSQQRLLTLFRALLLGTWYRLFDVQLAQRLYRDLLYSQVLSP